MSKKKLGESVKFCPGPIVLVGANVNGKPNYSLLCCNIMGKIVINIGKNAYSYSAIKESGNFSINFPSEDHAEVLDFCGYVTGAEFDKSTLFKTFYSDKLGVPMIEEFPASFECRVIDSIDLGSWEMIIGDVVETYADDKYLTNGWPDIKKIKPLLYAAPNDYWSVGEHFSTSGIGQNYR